MATFDKHTPSTWDQCGNAAGYHYCVNAALGVACTDVPRATANMDHMHRACFTCSYEWAKEPIV